MEQAWEWNAYKGLERPPGKSRHRWNAIIEINHRKQGWRSKYNSYGLEQGPVIINHSPLPTLYNVTEGHCNLFPKINQYTAHNKHRILTNPINSQLPSNVGPLSRDLQPDTGKAKHKEHSIDPTYPIHKPYMYKIFDSPMNNFTQHNYCENKNKYNITFSALQQFQ